jgi:hypothetical protein
MTVLSPDLYLHATGEVDCFRAFERIIEFSGSALGEKLLQDFAKVQSVSSHSGGLLRSAFPKGRFGEA